MEKVITLDITQDPHKYASDNNIDNWWCVNKGSHYDFYYITEDEPR